MSLKTGGLFRGEDTFLSAFWVALGQRSSFTISAYRFPNIIFIEIQLSQNFVEFEMTDPPIHLAFMKIANEAARRSWPPAQSEGRIRIALPAESKDDAVASGVVKKISRQRPSIIEIEGALERSASSKELAALPLRLTFLKLKHEPRIVVPR